MDFYKLKLTQKEGIKDKFLIIPTNCFYIVSNRIINKYTDEEITGISNESIQLLIKWVEGNSKDLHE